MRRNDLEGCPNLNKSVTDRHEYQLPVPATIEIEN